MGKGQREPSRTYTLDREQIIALPIDEAFAFFSNAENLGAITPGFVQFRLLTPAPVEMKRGGIIEYRIRIKKVPVYWRTLIAEWEPPFRFVDVQQKGPYSYWRHEHTFVAVEGGTLMRDHVSYRVPLGPVGWLAQRLFVASQLRSIWDYREKRVAELLTAQAHPQAAEKPL